MASNHLNLQLLTASSMETYYQMRKLGTSMVGIKDKWNKIDFT